MYNYDLNIPLVEYDTKKYTVDECFDIILDVVKVLEMIMLKSFKKQEMKDGLIIIHMPANVLVLIQADVMIPIHIY